MNVTEPVVQPQATETSGEKDDTAYNAGNVVERSPTQHQNSGRPDPGTVSKPNTTSERALLTCMTNFRTQNTMP